ncbi:MAG: hypothetical protein JXB85_16970, partial [Anaerolineales bacterium]|nr:hypothetical protein [Anaerolineales bacterium]
MPKPIQRALGLGNKVVSALVFVSLTSSSMIGVPTARAAESLTTEPANVMPVEEGDYQAPVFTHPEARMAEVTDQLVGASPLLVPRQAEACPTDADLVISATCSLAAGTHTYTSITIQSGGILELPRNPSTGEGVTIVAQTITVETGGMIHANGLGYPASSGPGEGSDSGLNGAGGAGHGGLGGLGWTGAAGGVAYDDIYAPFMLGSGGGNSGSLLGGAGGGAMKIVADTL